ncbi:hypothetical protein AHAS_Ahas05G0089000 [Arachis hypogaea]
MAHRSHISHTQPSMLHLMLQCLDLAFQPPEGINFQGSEFAMTAYIFSKNLDERLSTWWALCSALTTSFLNDSCQPPFHPVNHSIDTFEFIHSNFMGYADNLHRIYVSIEATLVPDDCGSSVPHAHLPGFYKEFIRT